MPANDNVYEDSGKSWIEILEQRSPESRAIVLCPNQAEQACMEAQRQLTHVIQARGDCSVELAALEAAFAEVDQVRKAAYRMARQ